MCVLIPVWQVAVVVGQLSAVFFGEGNHAFVDVVLIGIPIAGKLFAERAFAKVAGVIEHDVENEFHAPFVHFIDKGLEAHILAFVAVVHLAHIAGVVAVVVETGSIFHDRRNPDGSEAQRLNVVEFFNQALKVAAPSRVAVHVGRSVPALHIVVGVTVVEAGGDYKIDTFVTEVGSPTHKGCLHSQRANEVEGQQSKKRFENFGFHFY